MIAILVYRYIYRYIYYAPDLVPSDCINLTLILYLYYSYDSRCAPFRARSTLLPIESDHPPEAGSSCASPEVLVNGSPSPDILDIVTGDKDNSGQLSSIDEIQFVGAIGTSQHKRICKIKCIKGVWVGPMCALQGE